MREDTNFLDTQQAARILGLSAKTLARYRVTGEGAAFYRFGNRIRYARLEVSERLSLWGLLGYGTGELDVEVEGVGRWSTDTTQEMAAAGARGVLVKAPEGSPGKPGLLELEHGPWKGRIRTLKQDPERSRDLRLTGRYRLTHVVEFDQGGGCFSGHDADRLLQAIGCFLSFANGGMCRLECPSGWDSAGKQVWARWSSPSEWRTKRLCWFDGRYAEPLVELFPGFMDRWKTEGWGDALGSAIWWYAQAISGPPIADQGIVAAQIAMERLSYEYCVRERALVSEQGFEKLWVSDRFRLLLRSLDVPIEIPGAAKALTSASRKEKWVDGPHALTEIRNRLVHSGRKRAQLEGQCYVDAWLLATQLLELTILALCSFKGEFSNGMTGLKEPVPWAP